MTTAGSFVSLYTGAGGLDLGFAAAGFEPAWANDIDSWAVATYNHLFPGHTAHAGTIRDQKLPGRHAADLVIGGPPCQGFSVAGRMNPNDPRSKHVWDFLGAVARIRPKAFIMENVKALAENRRWTPLVEKLMLEAQGLGYDVSLLVLDASQFGVPQSRQRMFMVGLEPGSGPLRITASTASAPPTVREALETLPRWGEVGNNHICSAKVTLAKKPVLRKSPYAGMLFNGQGRPLNLNAPALTLPASMGGNRTPIIDQQQFDEGGEHWVIAYHEHLRAGKPPLTEAPARLRRLTVEEAGAIQTFPKGMLWEGPQSAQYRQIGNAVPPALAQHVAEAVRDALQGVETESDGVVVYPRAFQQCLLKPAA